MKPRTTGAHPAECPACEGFGYTAASATEMVRQDGKLITVKLGSACLKCHGTGRLNAFNALIDNGMLANFSAASH